MRPPKFARMVRRFVSIVTETTGNKLIEDYDRDDARADQGIDDVGRVELAFDADRQRLLRALVVRHGPRTDGGFNGGLFSVRKILPSWVRSWTKSQDQTWFGRSGRSRTHEPSLRQRRPFFGCFCGTFSPSRRQIRFTRLWFTCQPDWFKSPVTIR